MDADLRKTKNRIESELISVWCDASSGRASVFSVLEPNLTFLFLIRGNPC
jgi:hypothetical protein